MLNIHELEKQWKSYKIKSYLPYAIVIVSLSVIAGIIYSFYPTQPKVKSQHSKKSIPVQHVHISAKKTKVVDTNKTIIQPKAENIVSPEPIVNKQAKLLPSMNFMTNIQHETQLYAQTVHPVQKTAPKKRIRKEVKKKTSTNIIENVRIKEVPTIHKEQKADITIERKETKNDIMEIIHRFKNNNNPALSLFIAKKYYELGNYHQSYNYALITNQINPNIEASWIVFAKSLVKLHKKDKAIFTLKEYINSSHSSSAEILLNKITSGKFK